MNYTVSLLTNKPDCQALINMAAAEKDSLQFRKTALERQRQTSGITSQEIETELAGVIAELTAMQTVFDSLPEGSTKAEMQRKIRRSDYKKFLLEQRRENYGVLALLEKEYDIACIEQALLETDAYKLALTNRMNELP